MHNSNVSLCTLGTERQDAEVLQGVAGSGAKPLLVPNAAADSPVDQGDPRREIRRRLPEHLRCVLPVDGDSEYLTLPQLEHAVDLLLKYEDCFVGASGKVGWNDRATHSIDTGVNRPVKQPPCRTSFEEKEQIECQLLF